MHAKLSGGCSTQHEWHKNSGYSAHGTQHTRDPGSTEGKALCPDYRSLNGN